MTRKQMLEAADKLHDYARSSGSGHAWSNQTVQITSLLNPRRLFVMSNHTITNDRECATIEASILVTEAHSPNW
jgi:hypothetical protein